MTLHVTPEALAVNRYTLSLSSLLLSALLASACSPSKTSATDKRSDATPEAQQPGPLSSELALAQHTAIDHVLGSYIKATNAAFNTSRLKTLRAMRQHKPDARPALDERTAVYSILFSGNVHGELEDCGCKKHPLGGLARRAQLIAYDAQLDTAQAQTWWASKELPPKHERLIVDAGNLFFASQTADRRKPEQVAEQKLIAQAAVDALQVKPPDAYLVSERDLVHGLDTLEALRKRANFPFISANLRDDQGHALYPGHVLLERQGKQVAVIGLSEDKPKVPGYYAKRGIKALSPAQAYRSEVAKLPGDVDLIVLLSNLGLTDTQRVVAELRATTTPAPLNAVIVSGTGRTTRQPEWVAGVPLVESGSRGKYLGRLDLYIRSASPREVTYANEFSNLLKDYGVYRGAVSSYINTRRNRNKAKRERQMRRIERDDLVARGLEFRDDPKRGRISKATLEEAIAKADKQLAIMDKRVALLSSGIRDRLRELQRKEKSAAQAGTRADAAFVHLAPLEIKMPQERATRRALDAYKKRLPDVIRSR